MAAKVSFAFTSSVLFINLHSANKQMYIVKYHIYYSIIILLMQCQTANMW